MPWRHKYALDRLAAFKRLAGSVPGANHLAPWLVRLSEVGTAGYPPETRRRLKILNMICYLIAISTLVYALQHSSLDYARYRPVILINLALVVAALAVPFCHRFNDIAGAMLIVTAEFLALVAFSALLGHSAGVHLQYFVAAAAPFVVLGLGRMWLILPIILGALVLHLVSWFGFPDARAFIEADREVVDSIYVQAAVTTFGLIAASVYYAFSLAERAKAETDALLRNILPDRIVERLKASPNEIVADSFDEASVLFADISGFVALARRLGASETVALLNHIVTEFDGLARDHGVEKIKTIGDAYMVASGIPEPVDDHATRLARMALDMQTVLARVRDERRLPIDMRIGIASGPIMAGVIGRQKFTYDVWGDAVNLAARLEGLSTPGRILVCPRCRMRLSSGFAFESRGITDIKGVGAQETWFLTAVRSDGAGEV